MVNAVKAGKARGQPSLKPEHVHLRQDLHREIDLLDHSQDSNLVAKAEKLEKIQAALQFALASGAADELFKIEIEKRLTTHLADLNDREKELEFQRKWVAFGYPPECLSSHPECVRFMMISGFGFNLKMFQNSPVLEPQKHRVRLTELGEPEILKEGKFCPWSEIKAELEIDASLGKVVSKQNPELSYNYIDPEGIVPKDRESPRLYPIALIGKDEFQRLHSHAATFEKPVVEECVMQIVTNSPQLISRNWFSENFLDGYPQHTAVRLIDSEGHVYSFSLALDGEKETCAKFAAGISFVASPDWQEARRFEETKVTSWTVGREKMQKILAYVEASTPKSGRPFCFVNQNCNSFAICLAALGGVVIETKTALSSLLWSLLPSIERVPLLGGPLSWIHKAISRVATPIFNLVSHSSSFYIPRKVGTVAANCLFWLLGSSMQHHSSRKRREVTPLFSSWWDLLDDEKCTLHHSQPLVLWQRRQRTTVIYRNQVNLLLRL